MIGGGCRVKAHSMPWVVSLAWRSNPHNFSSGHHCGGTLISKNLVLTAAHCGIGWTEPEKLIISVGDHDIKEMDGEQIIEVEKIITHKGYTGGIENSY